MGNKVKIDDREYDVENLSDQAKATLASLKFVATRVQELRIKQVLLQRAKDSYIDSLKMEMHSREYGILFGDD